VEKWSEEKWQAAERRDPGRAYIKPTPEPIWHDAVAVLGIAAIGVLIMGLVIYALAGPAHAYDVNEWGRPDVGYMQRDTGSFGNGSSSITPSQQRTWFDRVLEFLGINVSSGQEKAAGVTLSFSPAQRQAQYLNDANKNKRIDPSEFTRPNGWGTWGVDPANGKCCISYSNGGFGPDVSRVGPAADNQDGK
jgi:hypothetical protein